VVGCEANRERLEQPLAAPDNRHRAAHVLKHQQPTAGPQHAYASRAAVVVSGCGASRSESITRINVLVAATRRLRVGQTRVIERLKKPLDMNERV